jgi:hypothetical protein
MSGLRDEKKHKSKRDGGAIAVFGSVRDAADSRFFRTAWGDSTLPATVIRCRDSVLPSQRTLASSTDTITVTLAREGGIAAQADAFCRQVAARSREGSEVSNRIVHGSLSSRPSIAVGFRRFGVVGRNQRAATFGWHSGQRVRSHFPPSET